jgi:hypothetical protein
LSQTALLNHHRVQLQLQVSALDNLLLHSVWAIHQSKKRKQNINIGVATRKIQEEDGRKRLTLADQTKDIHRFLLADAVSAILRLQIHLRIPDKKPNRGMRT